MPLSLECEMDEHEECTSDICECQCHNDGSE